jgi:SAM-dependent methyltransferase
MSVLGPHIPDQLDSRVAGLTDAVASGWFLNDSHEYFRGFPVGEDDIVLDVGCGEGPATLFAARHKASVIYSDIDAQAVASVTQKLRDMHFEGTAQAVVCNSNPLLLADACATRVICSEVLEHLEEPEQVMAELVRVGRPGALYLLTVPGARGEKMQQRYAPAEYFQKPNHIRIFEESDFRELVTNAGLVVKSYAQTGFYWVAWMSIYWAVQESRKRAGIEPDRTEPIGTTDDAALHSWASLWARLISTPEGMAFKHEMDALLPKNQVIVAQKT